MEFQKQLDTIGKVKWFDNAKGYGFIIGPENADIMIHYNEIDSGGYRTLSAGDTVEFKASFTRERGWKATYAVRIDNAANSEFGDKIKVA